MNCVAHARTVWLVVVLSTVAIFSSRLSAADELIELIRVEGNQKVEEAAILGVMRQKAGKPLNKTQLQDDIRSIFGLNYFANVQIYKDTTPTGGAKLIVQVQENPAIVEIRYDGLNELKAEDFKDLLETKLYTIADESRIREDLKKISKKYAEKGFYLTTLDFELEPRSENEVALVIKVAEKGKVLVSDVRLIGVHHFSHSDVIEKLASKPYTRTGSLGSGSLFQEAWLQRDVEFLNFYYRDAGFANVKVGTPVVEMDQDQRFVHITFFIEEGLQYNVNEIKVSGDVGAETLTEAALLEKTKLKKSQLFRYSFFSQDVESIIDRYGSIGYAYVDVNPKVSFNDEERTVDIDYEITKGKKVYFGEIFITGNTKTRDNVIRREFAIADGALYDGTGLSKTKKEIERLGFFEEVKTIKKPDENHDDRLNLKVQVKETSTGQFQMSFGFSPGGARQESWFGQTRYADKNQSGRGWTSSITGRYANTKDYDLELGFTDPKVYDSDWSLGFFAAHRLFKHRYFTNIEIPETQTSFSVQLGRRLFELVRSTMTLRQSRIRQLDKTFVFDDFKVEGRKNSLSLGLSRDDLNNYITPTEGLSLGVTHTFNGGPLGGDFQFAETVGEIDYYYPIDFTETYRTNFKLHSAIGRLWRLSGSPVPPVERYKLGGYNDLRGYNYQTVGPTRKRIRSPLSAPVELNYGGDKKLLFQVEYFVPLISEAGIKGLIFGDAGRVYEEDESISLSDLKKDAGFGFRWNTALAPFRFEWAFPYLEDEKKFGEGEFIFSLGY